MSQGPLGLAWENLRQKILDDGRYSVDQLDLETWRLMFMRGASAALSVPDEKIERVMLISEVLTFELSLLKNYGRPRSPVLTVIDGGNHDKAGDERPETAGTLPQ
ncbi:hypothetical protein EHM76_00230 [bacterium]|nr:MAG: hypothetical protein EHM76_00230 [bacterium]